MTSSSGSFDFLLAIGFPLGLPPEAIPAMLDENGIVFLFGLQFYPVLARFTSVGRALAVKTIFNFLGPLLNPARPAYRVLGVPDSYMQSLLADYLSRTPELKKTLVVRGESGLDEIEAYTATDIIEVDALRIERTTYTPGVDQEQDQELAGFPLSAQDDARIFHALINGEDKASSYYKKMICLNAGAGFYAAGWAKSIDEGRSMAEELLFSVAVADKFEKSRRSYARCTA